MTDKTDSPNPINVPLPKDLEYENTLNYRQLKPIISSTETSDDEKSGENTPINFPTPPNPNDPPLYAFLNDKLRMASQGTGGNVQKIGDRAEAVVLPRANIVNVADVADRFKALSIDSQNVNYLAPDDIVKKYRELEIQQQRYKVYHGKVICAILYFVKTLKDPTQELNKIVDENKKRKDNLFNCANCKSSVLQRQKKFLSSIRSQSGIPPLNNLILLPMLIN